MYPVYTKRITIALMISLVLFCTSFVAYFTVSANTSENAISQSVGGESSSDTSLEVSSDSGSAVSEVSTVSPTDLPSSLPESISSTSPTSETVSVISEGTLAPDDIIGDEEYSYVGSYAGLASNGAVGDDAQQDKGGNNPTAEKYRNLAIAGIILFGLLSVSMIVALIYFNIQVARSKKEHPELYPLNEKPKH